MRKITYLAERRKLFGKWCYGLRFSETGDAIDVFGQPVSIGQDYDLVCIIDEDTINQIDVLVTEYTKFFGLGGYSARESNLDLLKSAMSISRQVFSKNSKNLFTLSRDGV